MSFSLENCVREFNINRKIIIRNCPIVTYEEVKRFLGNFKVSNIAISKRHKHSIVELRHGEEAEKIVTELNGKNLCGKQVTVSLFRQDNLLCVCNISETMDDFDWRSVVLPFGIIEKAFVMRNTQGESLGYAFVEFMHNREKSEQARRHIQQLKLSTNHNLRCVFLADHVTTFDQLYSSIIMMDHLPVDCSLDTFQRFLFSLNILQPIVVQMGMKCAKTSSKFALLQYSTHTDAYKALRCFKEFRDSQHEAKDQESVKKHFNIQQKSNLYKNLGRHDKLNENRETISHKTVNNKANDITSILASMDKLEMSFCSPGEKMEDLMKQISSFNKIFSETVDCSCVHPLISQLLHNHQPIHDDFNSLLKMKKNMHTNNSCILNRADSFYHQLTLLNDFLENHKNGGLKDKTANDQDIISNIQKHLNRHSGVDVMRGVDMSVAYQNIMQQQLIIQQQQQILLQQKQIEKKLQQQKQQSSQPIISTQQLQAPIIYQQLPANLLPQPYITPPSYQPLAFYPVINPSIPYAYPMPTKHFVPLPTDVSKIPNTLNDVVRATTVNQLSLSNTNNSVPTASGNVINNVDMANQETEANSIKEYMVESRSDGVNASSYNRVPFNERHNNYANDINFHKNDVYNTNNTNSSNNQVNMPEENKENAVYGQSNPKNDRSNSNESNIDDVINSILSNYKNKINIRDYATNVNHQQKQSNSQQNHLKQAHIDNHTTQRPINNTILPQAVPCHHHPHENHQSHAMTANGNGADDRVNDEDDDEQYVMARTDCDSNDGGGEDEDFKIKSGKDASTDVIINFDEGVHDVCVEGDIKNKHVIKNDLNDLSFYSYSKVICNGIYGNLATIVDNCCNYSDQQETPIRRPDRVPGFIQSPEASPEGWYVGQHSQGLGGHYEESLLKKRNSIMQ